MKKIILATDNLGKLKEMQALLQHLPVQIIAQSELNIPSYPETGLSFIENALGKARHAAKYGNLPAVADDSGLAVDALAGQPGIYSARYAGPGASSQQNMQKLLSALATVPAQQRQAQFHCSIAFVRGYDDPLPIICQGEWRGEILMSPQGEGGFGYDPLFYVPELKCSAAELSPLQKNHLSHRAKALAALMPQLAHVLK